MMTHPDCLSPSPSLMIATHRCPSSSFRCVTPEAVRLIVASALAKLRACPNAECLVEGPPQAPLTTTNGRIGAISY